MAFCTRPVDEDRRDDMVEFDPGPPSAVADHLAAAPGYAEHRDLFWYDWGPIYYRGRLDGSARLLCIASDPGPTERSPAARSSATRASGSRVPDQARPDPSYCLAQRLRPRPAAVARPGDAPPRCCPSRTTWPGRNKLLNSVVGPKLEAVVAFGVQAQAAAALCGQTNADGPAHQGAASLEP